MPDLPESVRALPDADKRSPERNEKSFLKFWFLFIVPTSIGGVHYEKQKWDSNS